MARDDDLFEELSRWVARRPGWTLVPSTSPGGATSWCFEEHGHILLSVTSSDATISAYLPDGDLEVEFADLEAFTGWVSLAGWDLYRA